MFLPSLNRTCARILTLALLLQMGFAGAAFANNSTRQNQALLKTVAVEPGPDAPTKAEIDQFKADLKKQLEDLETVTDITLESEFGRDLVESAGLDPKGALKKAIESVPGLTDEEVVQLKNAYEKNNPNWKESGQKLKNLYTDGVKERLKGLPARPGRQKNKTASLRFSLTSDQAMAAFFNPKGPGKFDLRKYSQRLSAFAKNSAVLMVMPGVDPQTCNPGPGTPLGIKDVYIAKGVALALMGIMEGFPTDALTIAARVAPIVAYIAAEAAVLVLEGLNEVESECEDAKFQDDTTTKLNSLQTSVAAIIPNDNQNKADILSELNKNTTLITTKIGDSATAIMANDNLNKAQIITNDNQNKNELRDLILRSQIEADLAQADGSAPVALYATPTAQGGYLDLVRAIVAQTITRILAAGGSVGLAQTLFSRADAYKTAGDFKTAYDQYRKAYRAAAK